MDYYLAVWRKYGYFSGRARRREFWYFSLFNFLIGVALEGGLFALQSSLYAEYICSAIFLIYLVAVFVPSLAVQVRRLHDIGKSGFWIFACLIPIAGPVLLIIFFCMDSEPGANRYGPNPKDSTLSEAAA